MKVSKYIQGFPNTFKDIIIDYKDMYNITLEEGTDQSEMFNTIEKYLGKIWFTRFYNYEILVDNTTFGNAVTRIVVDNLPNISLGYRQNKFLVSQKSTIMINDGNLKSTSSGKNKSTSSNVGFDNQQPINVNTSEGENTSTDPFSFIERFNNFLVPIFDRMGGELQRYLQSLYSVEETNSVGSAIFRSGEFVENVDYLGVLNKDNIVSSRFLINTNTIDIDENRKSIDGNIIQITSNIDKIRVNTTNITKNTTDIRKNSQDITKNIADIANKQEELIAGTNITITGNTISASGSSSDNMVFETLSFDRVATGQWVIENTLKNKKIRASVVTNIVGYFVYKDKSYSAANGTITTKNLGNWTSLTIYCGPNNSASSIYKPVNAVIGMVTDGINVRVQNAEGARIDVISSTGTTADITLNVYYDKRDIV